MRTVRQFFSASSVAVLLTFGALATQPAAQTRPTDATGQCKDGTYTVAKSKSGACSGHGGVTTWFADAKNDTKAAAKATKDESKTAAKATKDETKTEAKAAKKETKDAAKSAGAAAKDTGKASGTAAKGVTKSTAAATKDATKTIAKPGDAPADATARCKDGTYSHAKQHSGACSRHGGVAEWYK
jgi:hypothetical protein